MLSFLGNCELPFKVVVLFCVPPATNAGSCCFRHSQLLVLSVLWVLDFQHVCSGISLFIEFAISYDVEHFFICLFAIFISSLVRCLQIFCPLKKNCAVRFLFVEFYKFCVYLIAALYQINVVLKFPPNLWFGFLFS